MTEGPHLGTEPASPAGRGICAAEVETEYEEDGDGEEDDAEGDVQPEVVEEELCAEEGEAADEDQDSVRVPAVGARAAAAPARGPGSGARSSGGGPCPGSARSNQTSDYMVPEANRDAWKNLGCDTEAGRLLRRLYGKGPSDAASKVSYPRRQSPATRWEPKPAPRKPCPQRAPIRVPMPINRRPTPDPDDPRNWRQPVPCRKPESAIRAEMENDKPEKPDLPKGRDQAAEKEGLQERFRFCGGRALPEGAMGNVPEGELPKPVAVRRDKYEIDTNGMTSEQRRMFEDLLQAVKRKQARIAEIDAEDASDPQPSKAKTARNKEALELRNDIDRCLADIDTLISLVD